MREYERAQRCALADGIDMCRYKGADLSMSKYVKALDA